MRGEGAGPERARSAVGRRRPEPRRSTPREEAGSGRTAAPRPILPERVAAEVVEALRRERREVFVPAWLRVPVGVRALAPSVCRSLAARFG